MLPLMGVSIKDVLYEMPMLIRVNNRIPKLKETNKNKYFLK